MVGWGWEERNRGAESSELMAMPPERSRPLHNFTLPTLRWGNQRYLRCMKINGTHPNSSPGSDVNLRPRPGKQQLTTHHNRSSSHPKSPLSNNDDGIEAVREKVMLDLRVAADRIKVSMFDEKEKPLTVVAGVDPNPNSNSPRPCNLRTRRAACKEPPLESPRRANCHNSLKRPESPVGTAKSTRLRGLAAAATTAKQSIEKGQTSQRPKFSISLSREEIESDFLLMAGKKPARRPKKRPRIVQKQLDTLFPGTWLTEVTREIYDVPDLPDSGKA